ncbi:MAG: hypothetical protein A2V88_13290, partial [Elusimicrobia bacterium RBG_16_66_12]
GDCRKCHASEGLSKGCLSCHEEIAAQVSAKRGFHGKTLQAKVSNCAPCHSDHVGKEFALINKVSWGGAEPKTFDHAQADYKLKGRHAALTCADCHAKRAPPFSLPRFPKNPRRTTFLGLSQECASCHKDPHAGGKADECAKCHSQDKWKPAPGFDHDKFYVLRDEHAKVGCAKCHAPGSPAPAAAAAAAIFGKTLGKKCADCHKTPHRTQWRLECGVCHTEKAAPWATAAARMTKPQHDATGFRVSKPHDKTACKACHDPRQTYAQRYSQPGAPGRSRTEKACEACHKDAHAGQFLPAHPRCLDCHKETTFKPSRFTAKEHAVWPLKDGHRKAACAACHVKDAALGTVRFVKVRGDCAFCHKDPHAGQFREGGKTSCERCHRDAGSWKKLVFDHNSMSRFKLDLAHAKVACKECHPSARTQDGRSVVLYKPVKSTCGDCHDFAH